jgi:hypothetical protein
VIGCNIAENRTEVLVLSYVKLSSVAASVVIAAHLFENPDFGLALCFAAFGASSLELLCFERVR